VYETALTIKNVTGRTLEYRVVPPATAAWTVNTPPTTRRLAPGLEALVPVVFRPPAPAPTSSREGFAEATAAGALPDRVDRLIVVVGGGKNVEVPLRGLAPAPGVAADGDLALGPCAIGAARERVVRLVNHGKRGAGVATLDWDRSGCPGLSCVLGNGEGHVIVGAGETVGLKATYAPLDPGRASCVVTVSFSDGTPPIRLPFSATAVQHAVTALDGASGR